MKLAVDLHSALEFLRLWGADFIDSITFQGAESLLEMPGQPVEAPEAEVIPAAAVKQTDEEGEGEKADEPPSKSQKRKRGRKSGGAAVAKRNVK